MTQKDGVAGTAAFQASAHLVYFNGKSAMPQALLEFPILASRPDGQHAIHFKSREGHGDSGIVIEAGVVGTSKSCGAVVDVQEHGVELEAPRAESDGDVIDLDAHACVFQGVTGEWSQGIAIPLDDRRGNLGYDDRGVRWEQIERRAERETHAEAPDKHARTRETAGLPAGERRERLFGSVHAAGHEALSIGKDDVLIAATDQLQDGTVTRNCLTEQLQRLHEGMLMQAALGYIKKLAS